MAEPNPPNPLNQRRNDAVKLFSVSSIGPVGSTQEVEKYMESPAGKLTEPYSPNDVYQFKNEDLFEIISTGINNIVLELKSRLGNNFTETNENAAIISQRLNDIKQYIDNDIVNLNNDKDDAEIAITMNPDYSLKTSTNFLPGGLLADQINLGNESFINLNERITPTLGQEVHALSVMDQKKLNSTNKDDIALIQNRLNNCQKLEFLYLKKHDEIMKIFAFTINLFDKYKYAIKVILFLLKHLVYKDNKPGQTGETEETEETGDGIPISLPVPIIEDIGKLVKDQKTIQGVINKMKDAIHPDTDGNRKAKRSNAAERGEPNETSYSKTQQNADSLLSLRVSNPRFETDINDRLKNPQALAPAAVPGPASNPYPNP